MFFLLMHACIILPTAQDPLCWNKLYYVCMLYISIDLAEQFSFSSILKTKSKTKPKQKIKCSMVLLLI